MKLNYTWIFIGFIIINSCGYLPSKKIEGTWKPVKVTVQADDISPELIKEATNMELNSTYIFKSNGKFRIKYSDKDYDNQKGKWRYNKNKKQLTLRYSENYKSRIDVPKLTRKYLWLKHNIGGQRVLYIRLERQK